MNNNIGNLKEQMCEIGRRIWLRGYCAGDEGSHSVRIDNDRYLCTPAGVSQGFLTPDDIVAVNGKGEQVEPSKHGRQRTSEMLMHLAVYQQRPDVKAVIHSRPPHATAFCLAGMPLPGGIHAEAERFLGKVPVAPHVTQASPDDIIPLIGSDTHAILVGNQGSMNFGVDLVTAYYQLETLDSYCRQLLLARQFGNVSARQPLGSFDARLVRAADGGVGADNESLLTPFDVRPGGASCNCNGGHVQADQPASVDEDAFEQMVQSITDQIMAAGG